jgi:gamma-glutamyltranspeptidase/glutathione hydrolase
VIDLLSKAYAAHRAGHIDPDARQSRRFHPAHSRPKAATHTYLSVVDRNGNMVSLIPEQLRRVRLGRRRDRTGFALQNRGGTLHTLDANHPNALAPRKRPLHTIIARLSCRAATPRWRLGIMGGGGIRRRPTHSSCRTWSTTA